MGSVCKSWRVTSKSSLVEAAANSVAANQNEMPEAIDGDRWAGARLGYFWMRQERTPVAGCLGRDSFLPERSASRLGDPLAHIASPPFSYLGAAAVRMYIFGFFFSFSFFSLDAIHPSHC